MTATEDTTVATEDKIDNKSKNKLWSFSSYRLQICLLLCVARATVCLTRGSMSVAMVCMTPPSNSSFVHLLNGTEDSLEEQSEQCNRRYQVQWSAEEQARVHTSYYIGATVGTLVTHTLIQTFGPKMVIVGAMCVQVLGSLLTPLEIIFLENHLLLAVIRFVMGFSEGVTTPAANQCIAQWFPVSEKSTATALFTIGNQIGVALSMSITAKLSVYDILGGWPSAVLLYGCVALTTLILWSIRGSSRAVDSRYIKQEELCHITGLENCRKSDEKVEETKEKPQTPWKRLLCSPCVIAICTNSFAHSFIAFGLVTYLPKFHETTLHMNLTQAGLLSALPFILQFAGKLGFGIWADNMKQNGYHVNTVIRLWNGVGNFGAAIFLCMAPFLAPISSALASIAISMSLGLFGAHAPGHMTAVVTVSPENTSAVSVAQSLSAQAAGICAQYIVGICTSSNTLWEWTVMFFCMAIGLVITGIQFQIQGHGKDEHWNLPKKSDDSQSSGTKLETMNA